MTSVHQEMTTTGYGNRSDKMKSNLPCSLRSFKYNDINYIWIVTLKACFGFFVPYFFPLKSRKRMKNKFTSLALNELFNSLHGTCDTSCSVVLEFCFKNAFFSVVIWVEERIVLRPRR